MHAAGPILRRALRLRLTHRDAYRRLVEIDTKPTSYVWSGLGFRYPLASTRGDLDVVARAGARLWEVLGLTAHDALLSAVPVAQTAEHIGLHFAAMASGAPAMFPGRRSRRRRRGRATCATDGARRAGACRRNVLGALVDAGCG